MKTVKDLLTSYLGDMAATQNHLLKTVEQQLRDPQVTSHAEVNELLTKLRLVLRRHTGDIEQRVAEFGGSLTADVKEAITVATGLAASLFGKIRPHAASKFLRDDYVLLSACSIGYEMLHVTALALSEKKTAEMALAHFKEITPMVVRLSEIMPGVVVQELTHDVSGIDAGAAPIAKRNTREAWSAETVQASQR